MPYTTTRALAQFAPVRFVVPMTGALGLLGVIVIGDYFIRAVNFPATGPQAGTQDDFFTREVQVRVIGDFLHHTP